jgi:predicted transcriptional regulator
MQNRKMLSDLRSGFFKSSGKIFRMKLDVATVAIYCFMCDCQASFNPSVRYISKHLKLSKTTVGKSIKKLIDLNVIKLVQDASRGQTTRYEFVNPAHWKGASDVPKKETTEAVVSQG